ncbi:MAG: DUF3052 domain-containing protein [Betaproteobacteria bacterium]|nr:DUF3052 domain-containing protein [Betaproteobacteria bacterium]
MTAGYSGTPLWKKLGLKEGGTLATVGAPTSFPDDLGELPPGANIRGGLKADEALCIVFVGDRATLERQVAIAAKKLHRDGSLWISWPKKSSKLFKDLTEDGIRHVVLPMGLVDVKVCAVNDDWSGLKLMVRKELRAGWSK